VEKETNIKIGTIKKTIHFHKFTNGDWFGKHNDIRNNRVYAVGVLLNDDFEGGDFKLYNPNEYMLNKEMGNTYLFDVRIEHEITPILSGERYSLLWFLQSEHVKFDINKLI
jgi:predicted 2-oxoglutarate/Fe(II)-dependent dioxygenase YbiX